ncbi:MAG: FeoB-associated Cys-rich membrane protein [Verrucomicrobiae bacterium]|nr:FeoB-associated Cys-rich membrane protein [Verrucomicrobiae bacterium]
MKATLLAEIGAQTLIVWGIVAFTIIWFLRRLRSRFRDSSSENGCGSNCGCGKFAPKSPPPKRSDQPLDKI